ncbi:alpha arabinofuranosidase [Aureobasidium sp. EXF-10728]|nr:alpha arabinofuranosidase [Aureobasidium sp. EXF-10728]
MPSKTKIAIGLAASSSLAAAAPCDIYASGGTPCVAAHGLTRALYDSYDGPLYQVTRNSDGSTMDVHPLQAGGVANAASQDDFCASTTCVISLLYDQSGNNNVLSRAPPGGFNGPYTNGYDDLASAIGAPVTLNGQKAYGLFSSPGTGYRNDQTTGIATGGDPEGIYAVMDSNHFNDNCCFDYGNAEVSNKDTGNGHMEAVYFGNCTVWDSGAGPGPWLMADLENGLFATQQDFANNPDDPTQTDPFFTGMVKGMTDQWALRGGNAQSGGLSTYWNGPYDTDGYNPMHKEGAIILGIGGDNSNGAQGTFYEGVMTSGYPSDDIENQVQANIVAAGYASVDLNTSPLTVGSTITIRATTPGYNTRYFAHDGNKIVTEVTTTANSTAEQQTAEWIVREGLGFSGCYSFESVDQPGNFIRHYGFELYVESGNQKQFFEDATFCSMTGLQGQDTNSIRSWSYPTRFFRHYANVGYIATEGGVQDFDSTGNYNYDTSFVVSNGFLSA